MKLDQKVSHFVKYANKNKNIILTLIIIAYLYSMFLHPLAVSGFDWKYLRSTLHSWQTLNASIIAFLASVLLLIGAMEQVNSQKDTLAYQKERDQRLDDSVYLARKAFLASALSALSRYTTKVGLMLNRSLVSRRNNATVASYPDQIGPLPALGLDYIPVFKELMCCSATPLKVTEWLTEVLLKLQVQQSRLEIFYSELMRSRRSDQIFYIELVSQACDLIELRALINRVYEYARNESELNDDPLTIDELTTACLNVEIQPETYCLRNDDGEEVLAACLNTRLDSLAERLSKK